MGRECEVSRSFSSFMIQLPASQLYTKLRNDQSISQRINSSMLFLYKHKPSCPRNSENFNILLVFLQFIPITYGVPSFQIKECKSEIIKLFQVCICLLGPNVILKNNIIWIFNLLLARIYFIYKLAGFCHHQTHIFTELRLIINRNKIDIFVFRHCYFHGPFFSNEVSEINPTRGQKEYPSTNDWKVNSVCLLMKCACTYFHDTLVDLHIPGTALRAANPVLIKESLTSRVSILHTQHTYTHSQVKYLNAHMKWVCAICKPSKWTHAISINCAWCPVYVCVISVTKICFSWHHCCCCFRGSQYFLHRVVTNLETLLPLSALSSSASISLALFFNYWIPQPTCLPFSRSFFSFIAPHFENKAVINGAIPVG